MKMREEGIDKALLLSSTGTGEKLCFCICSKRNAAAQSIIFSSSGTDCKAGIKSYRRVFGSARSYGLLSGNAREMNAEFVFSTMQMMAKSEIYEQYEKMRLTLSF